MDFTESGDHAVGLKPTFSVAIVQKYVPSYRLTFFEEVRESLAKHGVGLEVFYGRPSKSMRTRSDEEFPGSETQVKTFFACVAGMNLSFRILPKRAYLSDLVIIEQAAGNLESYLIVGFRRLFGLPTASWGHGRTVTSHQNRLAQMLQVMLLRQSALFLAYTKKSASRAVEVGYPAEKITVVNNSHPIVRNAQKQISSRGRPLELGASLEGRWIALFIGALDESKNLDTMQEACELVWRRHPEFLLLMAGRGSWNPPKAPWLKSIGRISDAQKIELAPHCRIILNPGRVGLIAVDSIALNLPLLTTNWPFHAPEIDYLDDSNSIQVGNDPRDIAEEIENLIRMPKRLAKLKSRLRLAYSPDHFDAFVKSFCEPIINLSMQKRVAKTGPRSEKAM